MTQDIEALARRLEEPINADKIYDWIVQARKRTRSDFPRMGFAQEMELIDDERKEAAAALRAQQWQDISTAPDYTRFLAWCPTTGICMMLKAGHESETWSLYDDVRHPEPTKWQPLPKAPQP